MAGIELGCPYSFFNSGGNSFVLNSPSDPNFVGYVKDITGLDMAGIRENAQVTASGDGGRHGPFWGDRRPFTFSGFIVPAFSVLSRDQAQERIEGIIWSCLKTDGTLAWTPADGIQKKIIFRAQQPARVTTGQSNVEKMYAIACVAENPKIVGNTLNSVNLGVGGTVGTVGTGGPIGTSYVAAFPTVQNVGNVESDLIFQVLANTPGALNYQAFIVNNTTNAALIVEQLASGSTYQFDLTGRYPSITNFGSGANIYGQVNAATDWTISAGSAMTIAGGNNSFSIFVSPYAAWGSAPTIFSNLLWRHSWI